MTDKVNNPAKSRLPRLLLVLALIFLVTGGLIWSVGASESFQECQRQANQQRSYQKTQKGSADFSVTDVDRGCIGQFLNQNGAGISAVGALITAALTFTLWWATAGLRPATHDLWRAAEQQGKDFRDSLSISESAANGAHRSAQAAQKSARAAIEQVETARTEIAAWIFIAPGLDTIKPIDHENVSFELLASNGGKSPARIESYCMCFDDKLPPDDEQICAPHVVEANISLGPLDRWVLNRRATAKKSARFVYDFVRYVDVFKRRRWSRFCGEFTFDKRRYITVGSPYWSEFT